mmetsp:Transcript_49288/g.120171  ORF Transcript_49288/g.120171 Transcript_49288/m.120171 type:complete len:263 (-) Transcript_49288:462-1250(-)
MMPGLLVTQGSAQLTWQARQLAARGLTGWLPRTCAKLGVSNSNAASSRDRPSYVTRRRLGIRDQCCCGVARTGASLAGGPARGAGSGVRGTVALLCARPHPGEDPTLVRGALRGSRFSFSESSRACVVTPSSAAAGPPLRQLSQTLTPCLPSHSARQHALGFPQAPHVLAGGMLAATVAGRKPRPRAQGRRQPWAPRPGIPAQVPPDARQGASQRVPRQRGLGPPPFALAWLRQNRQEKDGPCPGGLPAAGAEGGDPRPGTA